MPAYGFSWGAAGVLRHPPYDRSAATSPAQLGDLEIQSSGNLTDLNTFRRPQGAAGGAVGVSIIGGTLVSAGVPIHVEDIPSHVPAVEGSVLGGSVVEGIAGTVTPVGAMSKNISIPIPIEGISVPVEHIAVPMNISVPVDLHWSRIGVLAIGSTRQIHGSEPGD